MFVSPESSPGRNFYPRPLRGGRRELRDLTEWENAISIHALCEEGDSDRPPERRASMISIHALCEEGDKVDRAIDRIIHISIHALCEEGDPQGRR